MPTSNLKKVPRHVTTYELKVKQSDESEKAYNSPGRDLFSEREDYVSVATVKSNHAMMIGLQDTLQGMGFSFFLFILFIQSPHT